MLDLFIAFLLQSFGQSSTLKLCTLNATYYIMCSSCHSQVTLWICSSSLKTQFKMQKANMYIKITYNSCQRKYCIWRKSQTGTAQVEQAKRTEGWGRPLTIRLRVVGPRLRVRDGGLARELLLEVSAETGREAVGRRIPKASRHAHRASAKRGYKTHAVCVQTHTNTRSKF